MNYRSVTKWALLGGILMGIAFIGPGLQAQNKTEKKDDSSMGEAMPPRECLRKGAMQLWAAEKAGEKVRKYLVNARKKKDIIRINCVQEKVSRMNTVLNLARKTLKDLRNAVPKDASGDKCRILYEKMTIFREQAENIRREAEGCSGDELTYTGKTKVTVEIDPSVPKDDPSEPPGGIVGGGGGLGLDVIIIGRPPEVSPYF